MIARRLAALSLAAVILAPVPATAGGFLHKSYKGPRAVSCYKKVYAPPVTKTVYKRVLVSGGHCDRRRIPAVYAYQQRAYVAHPGQERVVATPPVYAYAEVRRLMAPGVRSTRYSRWAGDDYKCDVILPPTYVRESVPVMVSPGQVYVQRTPPVMGVANEKVIVQPAHTQEFCQPPVYRTVARQVVVSPGRWYWRPVEGAVGCGRY